MRLKLHPKHREVVELSRRGVLRKDIAAQTGVPLRQVRHIVERDLIEQETRESATPIAWETIPGNQREKLEATRRSIRRELEKEYRAGLATEVELHKVKLDQALAAYTAKLKGEAEAARASRDAERERYRIAVAAYRAKGLIPLADYRLILSCLHPDSRHSASDEKLATAFRVFTDPKVEALLVKETP